MKCTTAGSGPWAPATGSTRGAASRCARLRAAGEGQCRACTRRLLSRNPARRPCAILLQGGAGRGHPWAWQALLPALQSVLCVQDGTGHAPEDQAAQAAVQGAGGRPAPQPGGRRLGRWHGRARQRPRGPAAHGHGVGPGPRARVIAETFHPLVSQMLCVQIHYAAPAAAFCCTGTVVPGMGRSGRGPSPDSQPRQGPLGAPARSKSDRPMDPARLRWRALEPPQRKCAAIPLPFLFCADTPHRK